MLAVILLLGGLAFWLFLKFGGRTPSRYLGQSTRQVIDIPEMRQMVGNINMWFDKAHNATVKDITYCGIDGYYYSVEYRDISPLEGVIPPNELTVERMGIADAAHVAFAEANANYFISCDDRLIKQCKKVTIGVAAMTPVKFCVQENLT